MLLPANYDGRTGFVTCNDGHDWFVVNIPMEAYRADDPLGRKPGELLWTKKADGKGWFDPGDMLKIKSAPHMQRVWAALYQQRPYSLHFWSAWTLRLLRGSSIVRHRREMERCPGPGLRC